MRIAAMPYDQQMRVIDHAQGEARGDVSEATAEAQVLAMLGEILSPVFIFIDRGRTARARDMRLWVVRYCMRDEARGALTFEERAAMDGVDPRRLKTLKAELQAMIPRLGAGSPPCPPVGSLLGKKSRDRFREGA